ncbi:hypothetical protein DVR12_15535 [Chitinophaga silvatica]|uniref:Uncharacterized protein n=1 Tax=Chitinophaga silvatica TaxID=2282649 RepID=A0A3E1Y9I6_9BACT|nr:hypothetical protein [Chitinophaga silvatica]RFS22052.1 hypothetical protein DVR12_15535 [Chitinophaga silvatica]
MKIKSWLFKIIITVVLIIGVAIAWANVPNWVHAFKSEAPVYNESGKDDKIVYTAQQEEKFGQLMSIYQHIDSCKELFVTGTFDGINPSDSANILHSGFKFCRKNDELYYQTGEVEMVSLKDMYLAISKDARKIFLNSPRKIVSPFQFSRDSLLSIFKSESYQMVVAENEGKTTLRFICPDHIYCKEYSFVIIENRLQEFSARLTNLDDPLNDAKDTRIKITINQWKENNLPVSLLKVGTYVKLQNGEFEPSSGYANYELIDYSTVNAD